MTYISIYLIIIFFFGLSLNIRKYQINIFLLINLFILFIIAGFRHSVGGDWHNFTSLYEQLYGLPYPKFSDISDPIFELIFWISGKINGGQLFVNIIYSGLFCTSLFVFSKRYKYPFLIIICSYPILYVLLLMGFERQSGAFALLLISLTFLIDKKILTSLFFFLIGLFAHKSILIFLPIYFINLKLNWKLILIFLFIFSFFVYVFYDSIFRFYFYYIGEGKYFQSPGVYFRTMIFIPSIIIFALYRKALFKNIYEYKIYLYLLVFFIAAMPLLYFSTSATDRYLYFFYPFYLHILASFAEIIKNRKIRVYYFLFLIFYHFSILLIWILFANNSVFWVPYKFYPLINL